jgi:hypothetical protein
MKNARPIFASLIATALSAVVPGIPVSARNVGDASGVPTQIVITVLSAKGGSPPEALSPRDFTVLQGKTPLTVSGLEPLAGDMGAMQLFILLDDSSPSAALSLHFGELRTFLKALPPSVQVAIGYMRNGTAPMVQPFTADHEAAASSLRLPLSAPGLNGSPYFALSDLIEHWPASKESAPNGAVESTPRRAVLMLTDGVDRYFGASEEDDPYADAAIRTAQKQGVLVYSIYLRDSGAYDRNAWVTNLAQSRLDQLTRETGGRAYFQDFTNPVTLAPFLYDLTDRLDHQYLLTIAGVTGKGLHDVKVHSGLAGIKVTAPSRVYAP